MCGNTGQTCQVAGIYRADCGNRPERTIPKGLAALSLLAVNNCSESRRSTDSRDLEKYKLDEARQRFFLEKRLEAMLATSAAMSDVTQVFFTYTRPGREGDAATAEVAAKEYGKALDAARQVINRSAILFPVEFNQDVDRYFEVHRAIMLVGVKDCKHYRDYLAQLSREFDALCQSVLDNKDVKRMTLAKIPFEERDRMTPKELLEKHHEHWKSRPQK